MCCYTTVVALTTLFAADANAQALRVQDNTTEVIFGSIDVLKTLCR